MGRLTPQKKNVRIQRRATPLRSATYTPRVYVLSVGLLIAACLGLALCTDLCASPTRRRLPTKEEKEEGFSKWVLVKDPDTLIKEGLAWIASRSLQCHGPRCQDETKLVSIVAVRRWPNSTGPFRLLDRYYCQQCY